MSLNNNNINKTNLGFPKFFLIGFLFSLISLNMGNWTICVQPLKLYKIISVQSLNFWFHTFNIFKIWTHLNRTCTQIWHNSPPTKFLLSFMCQCQLDNLGKLATFACWKRISVNPKCYTYLHLFSYKNTIIAVVVLFEILHIKE